MAEDRGILRQVAWRELLPWLALTRSFRLAIQVRLLALAAVALALTVGGWWGIGWLFAQSDNERLQSFIEQSHAWPGDVAQISGNASPGTAIWFGVEGPADVSGEDGSPLAEPWWALSAPFRQLFAPQMTLAELAYLLLTGLWVALVWSFFGGVITRLVTLNVARSERASLRGAMRFVLARYAAYFAAPLFPLLGVLLIVLPIAIVGLLGRTGGVGLGALAVVWPAFLLGGLLITIFVVGLLFGWPLMWPTISTEGTDSFDALSRSYSYVYQRPLYFLFLVFVAGLLGSLGWLAVRLFVGLLLYLTAWSVSWGAGGAILGGPDALAEAAPTAAHLMAFWTGVVSLLVAAFLHTFFFSSATIIYYLLRYDVDGTEMDEVFVDEPEEKHGLPAISTDAAGVPVVNGGIADDELAGNVVDRAE